MKKGPISQLEGQAPEGPHLAVITDMSGMALALPPGTVMLEVLDPTRPDRVTRMVLQEVKHGRWTFQCGCGNPHCKVKIVASLTQSGSH